MVGFTAAGSLLGNHEDEEDDDDEDDDDSKQSLYSDTCIRFRAADGTVEPSSALIPIWRRDLPPLPLPPPPSTTSSSSTGENDRYPSVSEPCGSVEIFLSYACLHPWLQLVHGGHFYWDQTGTRTQKTVHVRTR